jgi:PAS domain S-box-containing protein
MDGGMAAFFSDLNLEKSATWYHDFINVLPLGVFRETLEGRIIFCNNTMAEILGFASFKDLIDYPITNLYNRQEDRRSYVEAVIKHGRVVELPILFHGKNGSSIWCSITAGATLDKHDHVVHLDGILREMTKEVKERSERTCFGSRDAPMSDFAVLLDPEGRLLDINRGGTELLGFRKEDVLEKPLMDFIVPRFRELFPTFLSIILKAGQEEGILTIMDRDQNEHHLEFQALVERKPGESECIQLMARNVTERIKYQKEQLSREKFLGVIEMAGGVAHKLNQPLMIIRNMVGEVLSGLDSSDPNYEKMARINLQIERIHELAKKIVKIRKYEPMEYVAGVRIVDIDRTS